MQSDRLVRHLKFRELNYLVTLGRISSIHRAAALHGISQPALSKTLRELESVLGFKIFERSRRGVAPTKLGEIVIAQAVQMISNLDALTARLDAERHGHRRIYRVGATPNPALRLIPGAYMSAREKFPDLVVELVEASTDELLIGVRRGEYSLVVARSTPQDSLVASSGRRRSIRRVGVVVGRAGHPAAGRHHRQAPAAAVLSVGAAAVRTDALGDRARLHARRMQSAARPRSSTMRRSWSAMC